MGRKIKNITGEKFGRLLALSYIASDFRRQAMWLCKCDCGKEAVIHSSKLLRGNTKSCGCLRIELQTTHGRSNDRTYESWCKMKRRCTAASGDNAKWYSGRGITFCERWSSFEKFLADMGERPAGETLDRINPNGNYEPENCRWATQTQHARNRTNTVFLECDGLKKPMSQWAEDIGLPLKVLWRRINRGWTTIDALRTPYGTSRI